MRIACIHIGHFAAKVEARDNPQLAQAPLVIGGFPHERKRVFDCSEEAAGSGISPGMPLRQAHHLCPDAVFMPLNEDRYRQAFEEVLDVLDRFSPVVETDSPGKAFLDISGTEQLFGPEEGLGRRMTREVFQETALRPRIGIGSGRFVAGVAALRTPAADPLAVKHGDERRFLEPLSIELLPLSKEAGARLSMLGLRSIGRVAGLPAGALTAQLGAEGLTAHRLASGRDESPLAPRPRPAMLEQEMSASQPMETREALLAASGRLLDRLLPQLQGRHQVCGQVRLRFRLENGGTWPAVLSPKTPTGSRQKILGMLKHRLETSSLPGAVSGLSVTLARLSGEHASQGSLLMAARARQEEALRGLAGGLKARLGRSPFLKVVALDPGSRIPERRAALVEFPSPED